VAGQRGLSLLCFMTHTPKVKTQQYRKAMCRAMRRRPGSLYHVGLVLSASSVKVGMHSSNFDSLVSVANAGVRGGAILYDIGCLCCLVDGIPPRIECGVVLYVPTAAPSLFLFAVFPPLGQAFKTPGGSWQPRQAVILYLAP
jgi:hypothetical protein